MSTLHCQSRLHYWSPAISKWLTQLLPGQSFIRFASVCSRLWNLRQESSQYTRNNFTKLQLLSLPSKWKKIKKSKLKLQRSLSVCELNGRHIPHNSFFDFVDFVRARATFSGIRTDGGYRFRWSRKQHHILKLQATAAAHRWRQASSSLFLISCLNCCKEYFCPETFTKHYFRQLLWRLHVWMRPSRQP